jgi:FkbM family methyltransferase
MIMRVEIYPHKRPCVIRKTEKQTLNLEKKRNPMKDYIKQMIVGTSFEPLARKMLESCMALKNRCVCPKTPDIPMASAMPESVDKNVMYDAQTVEVMRRVLKKHSNCIDVGCHEGNILKEILRFSPEGTHFAFEPIPKLYEKLKQSFGNMSNVLIFDIALSDTSGESSFQYVVTNPGYSGLKKRRYDRPNEKLCPISVHTGLLDEIIPETSQINFMKVDVEGAEFLVFKGGEKTIRRNRPVIVFEHGLGAADYYGAGPDDIFDLLTYRCGLRLFLMSNWLENPECEPLSRQFLSRHFREGTEYYFMAHP